MFPGKSWGSLEGVCSKYMSAPTDADGKQGLTGCSESWWWGSFQSSAPVWGKKKQYW